MFFLFIGNLMDSIFGGGGGSTSQRDDDTVMGEAIQEDID